MRSAWIAVNARHRATLDDCMTIKFNRVSPGIRIVVLHLILLFLFSSSFSPLFHLRFFVRCVFFTLLWPRDRITNFVLVFCACCSHFSSFIVVFMAGHSHWNLCASATTSHNELRVHQHSTHISMGVVCSYAVEHNAIAYSHGF